MKPLPSLSEYPAFAELFKRQVMPALGDGLAEDTPLPRSTRLPVVPWLQVSDARLVRQRGVRASALLPCFGDWGMYGADGIFSENDLVNSSHSGYHNRYHGRRANDNASAEGVEHYEADLTVPPPADIVLLPIGCFGDRISRHRPCTRFGAVPCLVTAGAARHLARCGRHRVVALLGDNFYPNGLEKRNGARRLEHEGFAKFWRYKPLREQPIWSDVYDPSQGSNDTNITVAPNRTIAAPVPVPYYVTLGNHDNLRPYLQYRTQHPHWILPGLRHVSPVIKQGRTTMQLFMLASHYFQFNERFIPYEAKWLDAALGNSSADWKIVATHEPIWGFAGFPHNAPLREHVHPVLVKHRVRLLIVAHTHGVSLHGAPGGYYQLTSAGFSKDAWHVLLRPRRPPGYYHIGTGAVAVLLAPQEATIVAVDEAGFIIFHHVITRERSERDRAAMHARDEAVGHWAADNSVYLDINQSLGYYTPTPPLVPFAAPDADNGTAANTSDTVGNVHGTATFRGPPAALQRPDPDTVVNPYDLMWQMLPECEAWLPFIPTDCQ